MTSPPMLTYFARHTDKLDIDVVSRQALWDRQLIAVHYPHSKAGTLDLDATDNASLDPSDYAGSARGAIRALNDLSRDGGYIYAEYAGQDCLVGVVERGTPIVRLASAWGSRYGHAGRPTVLKTLQLSKVKRISKADSAAIVVGRPRMGTLQKWPRAGKLIENLVNGVRSEQTIVALTTDLQEVLCAEFLRLPAVEALGLPRLVHQLLPIGRTMRHIDLLGLAADGRRLFAQVTHYSLADAGKSSPS
ncbi:MAG TPA: hypothetical protein VD866_09975 [Urbifossiella sp.]|nr:hypothetical protein [Urbifossiella sp.]